MGYRIRGTMVVHDLNITLAFTFSFVQDHSTTRPMIVIGYDLHLSDSEYSLAAHIISRSLDVTVEWQDIVGMKHVVRPNDVAVPYDSSFDPRYAIPRPQRSMQ